MCTADRPWVLIKIIVLEGGIGISALIAIWVYGNKATRLAYVFWLLALPPRLWVLFNFAI